MSTGYPSQWEADVVMTDGGTGHLRPIQPEDAERLVAFHNRLSPETIRYRFFAPHPTLSRAEVEDFTRVDHDQRVALVAVLGSDLVAVVALPQFEVLLIMAGIVVLAAAIITVATRGRLGLNRSSAPSASR